MNSKFGKYRKDFENYPLICLFLSEIDLLIQSKARLSVIFMASIISELVLREQMREDDEDKITYGRLIAIAKKNPDCANFVLDVHKSTVVIRNLYFHITNDKLIHNGLALVDDNGKATLVSELSNEGVPIENIYNLNIQIDVEHIVENLMRILESFQHQN